LQIIGPRKFGVIAPTTNAAEAAGVESLGVITVDYLTEAVVGIGNLRPLA
jgi:hypothetical protein